MRRVADFHGYEGPRYAPEPWTEDDHPLFMVLPNGCLVHLDSRDPRGEAGILADFRRGNWRCAAKDHDHDPEFLDHLNRYAGEMEKGDRTDVDPPPVRPLPIAIDSRGRGSG